MDYETFVANKKAFEGIYQNNIVNGVAQPIMVFPGVTWKPLGKPCEVNEDC